MSGYPGGLWSGSQFPSPPLNVLGEAEDSGKGGRVLSCTFRGYRGVTQGDTLLPNIFNVVVDAAACHWKSLLAAERKELKGVEISGDEGDGVQTAGSTIRDQYYRKQWTEEGHQWLTVKEELCYADYVLIASTDPGWLQSSFNFLTGLFYWVGLRTNIRKTVGMVSRPFRAYGVRSYRAYTHR